MLTNNHKMTQSGMSAGQQLILQRLANALFWATSPDMSTSAAKRLALSKARQYLADFEGAVAATERYEQAQNEQAQKRGEK